MKAENLPAIVGIGIVAGLGVALVGMLVGPLLDVGAATPAAIGASGAIAGVVSAMWLARKRNSRG